MLDNKYKREDIEIEIENGNTTKIISNGNYDFNKISDTEKEIIDTIIKILKNKTVTISHKEEAWKKTKRFEKIPFDYAMNLNVLK